MASAIGFPSETQYVPVPAALLGPLLQEILSLEELKCTLRLIGMVRHRRSRRLWVALSELLADPILTDAFAGEPGSPAHAIHRGVQAAVLRGTVLEWPQPNQNGQAPLLFINDESGRRSLAQLQAQGNAPDAPEPAASPEPSGPRPNIFALYEENIGPLTPLLAEELKEAEQTYPWHWIQDAFREAAALNHRSWRYIARILERWATEGKQLGEPGRHPQTSDRQEYLRDYLRRRGRPGR